MKTRRYRNFNTRNFSSWAAYCAKCDTRPVEHGFTYYSKLGLFAALALFFHVLILSVC